MDIISDCDSSRLLEKGMNFHCIYDFSVFVPGVAWQKQKLAICI